MIRTTKRRIAIITLIVSAVSAIACTSALIGRDTARHGRMLLWKHRDSGVQHSFVERVAPTDSTLAYVALFNAGDTLLREAWIGFNSAGFAIMNTASYNLAPDTAQIRDREGLVMAEALSRCHSVADFTALLDSAMHRGPLGVQANFGTFDSTGNGAYIECTDHEYRIFPLNEDPNQALIRTNYSVSGGDTNRLGEVRYRNAAYLLHSPIARNDVSPELFTDTLSRSFFDASVGFDRSAKGVSKIADKGEMIPRRTSTASVVIEGSLPGENAAETMVMWVSLGFPPASHVEAVTLDSVPEILRPTGPNVEAPMSRTAFERRERTFQQKNNAGKWLFDLNYLTPLSESERQQSLETYERERKRRHGNNK